jgi:hypothetical protein
MSRGLTDEPVQPASQDNEVEDAIRQLIRGQNMLHDRLVDLERKNDHKTCKCENCKCEMTKEEASAEVEAADRKFWKRGL